MVEITIFKNRRQELVGFDICGHAGMADKGQDILCAAISVLVINTIHAIERYTNDEAFTLADEEQGMIQCRFEKSVGKDTDLLLRTMILGLENLEDNPEYEPYMDIIHKEV